MLEPMPMCLQFFTESMMTQVKHHRTIEIAEALKQNWHHICPNNNLFRGTSTNFFLLFFLWFCIKSTGIINLKASKTHKNKFEQGFIDEFIVEAVNLGELKRIRIGHDSAHGKILECFTIRNVWNLVYF